MELQIQDKKFLLFLVTNPDNGGACPRKCGKECPVWRATNEYYIEFLKTVKSRYGVDKFVHKEETGYKQKPIINTDILTLYCTPKSRIITAKTIIREEIIGKSDFSELLLEN